MKNLVPIQELTDSSKNVRIFCLGMSDQSWPERIYRISKRLDAEIVYWTGMRKRRTEVKKMFPDVIFQELSLAIKGVHPKNILSKKENYPLDRNIIDMMIPYQLMAMKMMERLEPITGSFTFEDRLRHYHRLLRYWYNIFKNKKPDICLFPITPHACYDYIIYGLAQSMGIKTLILDRTAIPSRVLIGTTIDNTTQTLENRYQEMMGQNVKDTSLPKYIETYLANLKTSYADGMPPNIRKKIGLMNFKSKSGLTGLSSSIKSIIHYELGVHKKQFLKGNSMLIDSYVKESKLTPENSTTNVYKETWMRILAYHYKSKLQKYYLKHQQEPDYSKPYIFVALHYQPERNTVPLAGAFFEQCLLVEMLSAAIPAGWKIYVKEHSWQWSYFSKGERARAVQQYRDMNMLKNVVFIPADTISFDLIDHAKATATIAGSAGWESINRGVPALLFGNAWYRGCEGAFKISDLEDTINALNLIQNGYNINQEKVRLFVKALEDVSVKTLIDTMREDSGELSKTEINNNLVDAMTNTISKELDVPIVNSNADYAFTKKGKLPVVIFLAEALTVLPEQLLVAENLLLQNKAYPILYTTKKLYRQTKRKANIEVLMIPDQRGSRKNISKRRYSNSEGMLMKFSGALLWFIFSNKTIGKLIDKPKKFYGSILNKYASKEEKLRKALIQRMEIAREKLLENNPKVLVTSDDRTLNHVMCWIKSANDLNIKTVLLPFALTHPDSGAFIRRERYQMHISKGDDLTIKAAAAKQYPQTVYNSKYGEMLFYPPKTIDMIDKLGLLPECPWIQGGGHTKTILAIGYNDKKLMEDMGVKPEKIIVTGQCSHDLVYKAMQHKPQIKEYLESNYHIEESDKIIVFAVPHMAEINALTWEEHLNIFEQILNELAKLPARVVLSLHPRAQAEKYVKLAEKMEMPILRKQLSEVLAAGDIFLATHSSTVRWAAMCNIPPIILDYDFGYEFLNDIDGAVTIKLPSDIAGAMLPLLTDDNVLADTKKRLHESTSKFAIFDGKATQRAIDVICSEFQTNSDSDKLVEQKHAA